MSAAAGLIRLRYRATCSRCETPLAPGTLAAWDKTEKAATCSTCLAVGAGVKTSEIAIDRGIAGASSRREFERRHERREAKIREQHKHLVGVLAAFSRDPQSTDAWLTGARGEETIGRSLDALRAEGFGVLHDRRIPSSKANIDHIVISPAGVFVVDTKHYRGRVEQRDVGGLFKTDLRLYVGGRDRTRLIDGIDRQVSAVRAVLSKREECSEVPITAAILFMSPDNWSLLHTRSLRFGHVHVLWGRALGKLLRADATLPADTVPRLERLLAAGLPSSS
jgi:nuclease-like protein